jgi:hypothetical protein
MSALLLAIDPGVTWCGAAVFDLASRKLFAARRIRGLGFKSQLWNLIDIAEAVVSFAGEHGDRYAAIAMEWPQVYAQRQRGRKDPNDLLPLTALEGAIAGLMGPLLTDTADAVLYVPHDWKGSKGANPTARWVLDQLDPVETAQVEDLFPFLAALDTAEGADEDVSHPAHNTLDAVGVGLKFLGRLERRRVIAR